MVEGRRKRRKAYCCGEEVVNGNGCHDNEYSGMGLEDEGKV